MIRSAWLILSVAALFGLQGPLCALACVEQAATPTAMAAEHAPCHGDQPTPPADPGSTDHECKCDHFQLVLSNADAHKVVDLVKAPALELAIATIHTPTYAPSVTALSERHRRLPPPDILLLKSSLLI